MKTIKNLIQNIAIALALFAVFPHIAEAATSHVSKPTFNPAAGVLFESTLKVKITSSTSGSKVRYTTNGSTPSTSSPEVPSGGIDISSTTTIKARAFKSRMKDSDVAEATFRKMDPARRPPGGTRTGATLSPE